MKAKEKYLECSIRAILRKKFVLSILAEGEFPQNISES